jgi:hypothetical protein
MKKSVKLFSTVVPAILLTLLLLSPLLLLPVSAGEEALQAKIQEKNNDWFQLETETISVLFPSGGKNPMFLWWCTENEDRVYVVKFQGLIEYFIFEDQWYKRTYQALAERLQERYVEAKIDQLTPTLRNKVTNMYSLYKWHLPILHFSAGEWELSGPKNITRNSEVVGLGFNFTLKKTFQPNFQFANGNVVIRCRFYYEDTTETVFGYYNYTVKAGELKMDLVVKHWEWNIDKINSLIHELGSYSIIIPERKASLALWVNLASINVTMRSIAEEAPESIESLSMARNMIVEDETEPVVENKTINPTMLEQPINVRKRLHEWFRLRFAKEDQTLAGFFKFVASAQLKDPESGSKTDVVPVKAAYIAAGRHMRLFMCYPYFGNHTLEHDPSLGIEEIPTLISLELVLILVATTATAAIIVSAIKWKKGTINIIDMGS